MARSSRKLAIAALVALALAGGAGSGQASEAYFMIVFSVQKQSINRVCYSHSFATFIRACGEGDRLECYRLETYTISWVPRTLDVHVYHLLPEPGTNLDLPNSLKLAYDRGLAVSMWGPYQIDKDLFDRALEQKARLESGAVRYKAIDTGYPTERVSNCIHAISDLSRPEGRLRIGTPTWGESASYFITLSLGAWIIQPHEIHEWLVPALGLAGQPIIRRDIDTNPTRRPVLRVFQTVAHWRLKQNLQN